jgi:hypothetical protein
MKFLKLDDVEVEFEQQGPGVSCKWCVYVRVRKGKHEKTLLDVMTDNMPFTKFTYYDKDKVVKSNLVKQSLCQ